MKNHPFRPHVSKTGIQDPPEYPWEFEQENPWEFEQEDRKMVEPNTLLFKRNPIPHLANGQNEVSPSHPVIILNESRFKDEELRDHGVFARQFLYCSGERTTCLSEGPRFRVILSFRYSPGERSKHFRVSQVE